MTANTFLSRDFKQCLRVCNQDFSYISNSYLFEGNILRFKALALHEIYKKHTAKNTYLPIYERDDYFEFDKPIMIVNAKNSLENAIKIFK